MNLLTPGLLVLALAALPVAAGDGTVSLGNTLRYAISRETDEEILEDYFDADYQHGAFLARLRYEVFQPSEEGRDREGQVFRAVGGQAPWGRIWAGHFYSLFGRGMAFHGYEDRDLRVDTSLDGLSFSLEHGPASFQALSGRTPGKTVVFHGVDGDVRPSSWISLGGSYLSRRPAATTGSSLPDLELGTGRVCLTAPPMGLAGLSLGHTELLAEVGERSAGGPSSGLDGTYVSFSTAVSEIALGLEYKDYRDITVGAEGKEYTTPPPAALEHTWTLLARHAHDLNADDERGGLVRVEWQPLEYLGLTCAASLTEDHSDHRLFKAERQFGEAMAEFRFAELSSTPVTVAGAWTEEYLGSIATTTGPLDDRRTHLTAIGEVTFPIRDAWSGRFAVEHQHTDGDAVGEFDLEHLELEVSGSPGISVAVVGEFSNVSGPQRDLPWLAVYKDQTAWFYMQGVFDLIAGHQLRVMVGSRPEGKVCAGGACRKVPAFDGMELYLSSMF